MRASGLTRISRRRVKDGKRNLERVVYVDSVAYSSTYNDVEYYRL